MTKLRVATSFLTVAAILAGTLVVSETAKGASATGRVVMRVLKTLGIEELNELEFGEAEAGAPAATIRPGNGKAGGKFVINGVANTSYTVALPKEIVVSTGQGGDNETIVIRNFKSHPARAGLLSRGGKQKLYIGATRDALSPNQKKGVYKGTYTVQLIY